MVHLFYTQFSETFSEEQWQHYFQQMPSDIQQRIHRYKRWENKYQLLLGRMLLKRGMNILGFTDFSLDSIFYNPQNCPLSPQKIDFNIAHSGNLVACAFSKTTQIGLDVERIKPIHLTDFDYVLNEKDQAQIQNAAAPYPAFFKIWTIKEAVTKAMKEGLSVDVQPIEVFENYALCASKKWYFKSLNIQADYAAHLVSAQEVMIQLYHIYFIE